MPARTGCVNPMSRTLWIKAEGQPAEVRKSWSSNDNKKESLPKRKPRRTKSQNTPLMNAIAGGYFDAIHEGIVKTLLGQSALKVNATNGFGQTALFIACQSEPKWKQCGALLLKRGSDLFWKDVHGETAVHSACRHGNMTALEELVQHDAILRSQWQDETTSTTATPPNLWSHNPYLIHVAAQHGRVDVVKFLLKHIPSPDWTERDSHGRTPLQCACSGPNNTKKKDDDNDDIATKLRHFQVVRCLFENGAYLESSWGMHALASAAAQGNHHIVHLLLSQPNTAATAASLVHPFIAVAAQRKPASKTNATSESNNKNNDDNKADDDSKVESNPNDTVVRKTGKALRRKAKMPCCGPTSSKRRRRM